MPERDGVAALSIRAVCQTAGVTAPTLCHHFGDKDGGDKDGLLRALIARGVIEFLASKRVGWSAFDVCKGHGLDAEAFWLRPSVDWGSRQIPSGSFAHRWIFVTPLGGGHRIDGKTIHVDELPNDLDPLDRLANPSAGRFTMNKLLKLLVPPRGLEPRTPRSTTWCSNQLS
jgi:hypothetical protein